MSLKPNHKLSVQSISLILLNLGVVIFLLVSIYQQDIAFIIFFICLFYITSGFFMSRVKEVTNNFIIVRKANTFKKVKVMTSKIYEIHYINTPKAGVSIVFKYKNINYKNRKAEYYINSKSEGVYFFCNLPEDLHNKVDQLTLLKLGLRYDKFEKVFLVENRKDGFDSIFNNK